MRARQAYRDVLAIRDARALIGASAASQLGDWLYNAALLGYVYSATHSAGWVGAATIARLLPYVLLGPVGGAIADRYPRRTVLIIGDLVRLALMMMIAATVATDGPVALVIGLTVLASAAGSAEKPAAMALLPRLVGASRLGPANALLHTVQDLGVVVGPAIGAILLAVAPDSVAFLANGGTFAVSALLISTIGYRGGQSGATASTWAYVVGGLRTAVTTPYVVALFVAVSIGEFTYGAQTVQLVVYAESSLGLGSGGYGVLLAALGVGGLLSAIFNPRLAASSTVVLVITTSAVLACATQFVYAELDVVAIVLLVTVIGGAGLVTCEVVGETALARIVPSDELGRVFGVFDASTVFAMIAGALGAPILIESTSLEASFLIFGAATLLVIFGSFLALRGLDEVSAERAAALAARIAVLERLPVTIGVPRLVLERLASTSEVRPVPSGVDIVVQGAPADAFYAVIEGRVLVHRDGRKRVHLGPGDNFGERGLLDSAPRNATVTTEMDTTLLRVDGHELLEALVEAPMFRPALDLSSTTEGVRVPDGESPLVDDEGFVNV